ncbi:MAG: Hpt domain-containing protein [Lachnospiraceae bacterium]|nr:Hpt domain-containing protein [Lachnospiraceae bacterium]
MADLKTELTEAGVDYEGALERFMGRDDLYRKFIFKFLDDKNMEYLEEHLKNEDVEEALKAAHTIKGVTGNLGFDNLFNVDIPLVEGLRAGSMDGAWERFEDLKKMYDETCEIIKRYAE